MNNQKETYICKVGKQTDSVKLATSIQLNLLSGKNIEIVAIGKEAVYIATKGICITVGFAQINGLVLHWVPKFKTVIGANDGLHKCAMSWFVWADDNLS